MLNPKTWTKHIKTLNSYKMLKRKKTTLRDNRWYWVAVLPWLLKGLSVLLWVGLEIVARFGAKKWQELTYVIVGTLWWHVGNGFRLGKESNEGCKPYNHSHNWKKRRWLLILAIVIMKSSPAEASDSAYSFLTDVPPSHRHKSCFQWPLTDMKTGGRALWHLLGLAWDRLSRKCQSPNVDAGCQMELCFKSWNSQVKSFSDSYIWVTSAQGGSLKPDYWIRLVI